MSQFKENILLICMSASGMVAVPGILLPDMAQLQYLCSWNGKEHCFTAEEFKEVQVEIRENQYVWDISNMPFRRNRIAKSEAYYGGLRNATTSRKRPTPRNR